MIRPPDLPKIDLEKAYKAIEKLEKEGPVQMEHPDPSQPNIIITAQDARELLELTLAMEAAAAEYDKAMAILKRKDAKDLH